MYQIYTDHEVQTRTASFSSETSEENADSCRVESSRTSSASKGLQDENDLVQTPRVIEQKLEEQNIVAEQSVANSVGSTSRSRSSSEEGNDLTSAKNKDDVSEQLVKNIVPTSSTSDNNRVSILGAESASPASVSDSEGGVTEKKKKLVRGESKAALWAKSELLEASGNKMPETDRKHVQGSLETKMPESTKEEEQEPVRTETVKPPLQAINIPKVQSTYSTTQEVQKPLNTKMPELTKTEVHESVTTEIIEPSLPIIKIPANGEMILDITTITSHDSKVGALLIYVNSFN